MKFKTLLIVACFSLASNAFAENHRYVHPKAAEGKQAAQTISPGYCEIELVNQSYDDVRVYGTYDDGSTMVPFTLDSYYSPYNRAYIDLFYYGYCHDGMNLFIEQYNGYRIYQGYTRVNTTLRVVPPYLANTLRVETQNK
ncbi:MAG: hypothetical protein WC785_04135 [Tatlockia sp.]|jgi:hypothetical protein